MDEAAKRRLAGAAVLVALAVIFVPMLVEDDEPDGLGEPIIIPEPPDIEAQLGEAATPPERLLDEPLPLPEPPTADATAQLPVPPPPVAQDVVAQPPAPEPRGEPEPQRQQGAAAPAVAGPKPVPPGVRSWVVQVASLGTPEAARGLQDKLRGKGFPAFVEQAVVNGKRYYRVRVGPEVDRARANGVARRIADDLGAKPLVQRYP